MQRNLLYLPGKGMYEDTTKTSSSEQAIKVESVVFQKLMEYRQEQNRQRIEGREDFGEKSEKNLLMTLIHYVQTLTYPGTDINNLPVYLFGQLI